LWTPQDVSSFSEDCIKLEATLETESRLVESQCNREATEKVERMLKASECLDKTITNTASLINGLRPEIKDQLRREEEKRDNLEALDWVSSIPVRDHHDIAKEGRTPDTGQWVFGKREFSQWESSQGPSLLWIHGIRELRQPTLINVILIHIAGAGKTKLVASIVDRFLQLQQTSQNLTQEALFHSHTEYNDIPNTAGDQRVPASDTKPNPRSHLAFFYCRRAMRSVASQKISFEAF
jgi:hypothetical protein